ncbi:MAG: hypothetical protein ACTSUK_05835, partial [Promethearchaeota archaeon]
PAPEPISPQDPDSNGKLVASDVSIPIKLDWCDVDEANSYNLKVYITDISGDKCHPRLPSSDSECNPYEIRKVKERISGETQNVLHSEYLDDPKQGGIDFFTKDTTYAWEVSICKTNFNTNCSEYSQRWRFNTSGEIKNPELIWPLNDPAGEKPVGIPLNLTWRERTGAHSYQYQITQKDSESSIIGTSTSPIAILGFSDLKLNTQYLWRVKSCWDHKGKKCNPDWSEQQWEFKTTGEVPQINFPKSGAQNVPIPIQLKWEKVSGARAYKYRIFYGGNIIFSDKISGEFPRSEVSIGYDQKISHPKQLTSYSWQVQTCADEEGIHCGNWSSAQSFETFRLPAPTVVTPKNGGNLSFGQYKLSWAIGYNPKIFQYEIKYVAKSPEEKNPECKDLEGKIIPQGKGETKNNWIILTNLKCLGEYHWKVRGCIDPDCKEAGEWSDWAFNLVPPSGPKKAGLIPCGKMIDDPDTPWDERESCEIKHLFLLLHIVWSFILKVLIPIFLVLNIIATGALLVFSFNKTTALLKIKSIWKAFGIGTAIILFSWLAINCLLQILEYNVNIWGSWYKI